jgi:hypothetical protein
MLDRESARRIASAAPAPLVVIDDNGVRELEHGWFFPYRAVSGLVAGSKGLVVNKQTGRIYQLGSAFPVERDLELYDRGYQFERYDLVILGVLDPVMTIDALVGLCVSVVEPTYEHGAVWRVPRRLSRAELSERLTKLPCVFGDVRLYSSFEILESARAMDAFRFEVLEYRPTT